MDSDVDDTIDSQIAAADAGKQHRYKFSAWLTVSVALHLIALSALIVVLGTAANPNDVPLVVPVNIVRLAAEATGPMWPKKADVPQQMTAPPSSPAAKPVDLSAKKAPLPPDKLEIKLRELAQLRQPTVDTHLADKGEGLARESATRPNTAIRPEAAISDFLRDQVEHHWSPDLAILHGRNISVLIRIALTSSGTITKADVVNNPALGIDPVFDDIASSARDAALLSSPLTLPPGSYAQSMDVILSLNTKDALR